MTPATSRVLQTTWRALAFVAGYVACAAFARHFVLAPGVPAALAPCLGE